MDVVHGNGGKSTGEASAVDTGLCSSSSTCGQKRVVESVVYQLVRVEGDGRLVPATDDEVLEVEHMLRDCKNEVPEFEGNSQKENTEVISEKSDPRLEETVAQLSPRNASHNAPLTNVATCSEPSIDDPNASSRVSVSGISSSSKPDFSLLKEEICLDNLTIRELQETFRAAFGRQTSVKDKLWLKRRITMGLTHSCDVPITSFILKEKKMSQNKSTVESRCRKEKRKCKPVCLSLDYENSHSNPAGREEKEQLCGKRLTTPEPDYFGKSEDALMEQSGSKRIRRPTKRYIEELSVIESKEINWRLIPSVKDSVCGYSYPDEAQVRRIHNVVNSNTLVTRKDSIGGSVVQIPYVSRERRRRPRKDFMALMEFPSSQRDQSVRLEHNLEFKNGDSATCYSDENSDMVPTSKGGIKRKHHRAWTLSEVTKLVEGVSRYGAGRWSEIRRLAFESVTHRTSVDLKDKWRNLLKASVSQVLIEKENQQARKHNNSIPIPASILVRVRQLAEMHRQSGVEFGFGKLACHSEKIVQNRGPGFL